MQALLKDPIKKAQTANYTALEPWIAANLDVPEVAQLAAAILRVSVLFTASANQPSNIKVPDLVDRLMKDYR
jgi:hypothetical protein